MLPIDFSETREAARINIETKQRAVELLKNDGTIVIFPGGGVSTAQRWFGPALLTLSGSDLQPSWSR